MAPEGNWMQAGIFGISVCIVSALAAFAQTSGGPAEFEVASVKVNTVGANEAWRGRENVGNTPATLTMQNVRLRTAMAWAYRVQGAQISGPTWLESERYDIFAKAASAVGEEQIRLMLQKLLADRFKLTFHRNTREMSAYVLVVAKGGLKVHESTAEGESGVAPAGKMTVLATARRTTVSQLAGLLSTELQTPVVDLTGLKGQYDFAINIAPYVTDTVKQEDVPGILAQAIEEQLGLRLESRRTAIEMLMVDHAEMTPVEN
jgi:uncharacterized protein (TIGR03435 family)